MNSNPVRRESLRIYTRTRDHLFIAIRRRKSCMAPRARELKKADFLPLETITDVPNSRSTWDAIRDGLREKGLISFARPSNPSKKDSFFRAFRMHLDVPLQGIIRDMDLGTDGIEWLSNLTAGFGCVKPGQTTLDRFLKARTNPSPSDG